MFKAYIGKFFLALILLSVCEIALLTYKYIFFYTHICIYINIQIFVTCVKKIFYESINEKSEFLFLR